MAEVSAEDRKKWNEFEYAHLKAIRELGIKETDLPNDIKDSIRGFKLGLNKIVADSGFQKLVTLSAEIGDRIITWHERGADKTEEEIQKEKDEEQKKLDEEAQKKLDDEEAERQRVLKDHSSAEDKQKLEQEEKEKREKKEKEEADKKQAEEDARKKKEQEDEDDDDFGLVF